VRRGACHHLLLRSRLDYIINNACQTVRRPPDFYAHMMEGETAALHNMPEHARRLLGAYEGLRGYHLLPEGPVPGGQAGGLQPLDARAAALAGLTHAAALSQVPLLPGEQQAQRDLFPEGRLDEDLQQVDLRSHNSWRMLLAEVPTVELLEVQLVNAIAPFVLMRPNPCLRTPERDKHIVNVSAMEGQFYRSFKTTRHPHTNMAKAALNMLTRTAAADYQQDGIHMNSVDTGWVTDEDPAEIAARKTAEHRFHPPLDIVDSGARIVDPIISGVMSVWGQPWLSAHSLVGVCPAGAPPDAARMLDLHPRAARAAPPRTAHCDRPGGDHAHGRRGHGLRWPCLGDGAGGCDARQPLRVRDVRVRHGHALGRGPDRVAGAGRTRPRRRRPGRAARTRGGHAPERGHDAGVHPRRVGAATAA
jgi:NAD(P)-dependent dehydrogenase (short-subunit alcohol dehydrogenase family)